MDGTDVLQVAAVAGSALERAEVDDDGKMGSFVGTSWPFRPVQPSPADFAEGIHAPLAGGALVLRIPFPLFLSLTVMEGCQHDLSRFRIELPVDANHAQHRGGDLQAANVSQTLGILESLVPVELLSPVGHGAMELGGGKAPRRLDESVLRSAELGRMGVAGVNEHLNGGGRELPVAQSLLRPGHPLQGPGRADVLRGRCPSEVVLVDQPRRRGEVPLPAMGLSAVDLRQPPKSLRLQGLDVPLELGEIGLELLVGHGSEVLATVGIDDRAELAHVIPDHSEGYRTCVRA